MNNITRPRFTTANIPHLFQIFSNISSYTLSQLHKMGSWMQNYPTQSLLLIASITLYGPVLFSSITMRISHVITRHFAIQNASEPHPPPNRTRLLQSIRKNASTFCSAPQEWQEDLSFVQEAHYINPQINHFLSSDMRTKLEQSRPSHPLLSKEQLILKLSQDPPTSIDLHERANISILKDTASQKYHILYAHDIYWDDPNVMLTAIEHISYAINACSDSLRQDIIFLTKACIANSHTTSHLPSTTRQQIISYLQSLPHLNTDELCLRNTLANEAICYPL